MTTARPERTALILDDEDQLLRLQTRILEKKLWGVAHARLAARSTPDATRIERCGITGRGPLREMYR